MARIVTFQVNVRQRSRIAVADGRRLTGEHEPAARLEHPHHLAQRQLDIGDVVQHGVPDHQVEGVVVVRDALRVGDPSVDVETEILAVAGRHLDHPRRQVGHRAASGNAGLNQVEQEEPAAAAQFQGAVVGQLALLVGGNDGVEAAARVVDAALVVGDRPLLVVGLGLPVVVQHLGELGVVAGGLHFLGRGMRVGSRLAGDIRVQAFGFLKAHAGQPNGPRQSGLGGGQYLRRMVDEPLRPGHRGVVHGVRGHHLVDQAQRQRLLGVDEPTGEHQVLGLALADRAGQPGRLARAQSPTGSRSRRP